MLNTYHGTNPAITRIDDLFGREDAFYVLDDHIKNRRSAVLMGVEGVGKSSLLNCYFNLKYRQKMAVEQRILIRMTDFPIDRDTDGIYQYLAEGVLHAVDALDQDETADIYIKLREKCIQKMDQCKDTASRFQQVCEIIQDFDYNIVLVIDGFERFVSSPHVKMEHHDMMNTLIRKNLSFVVATDFDFNKDSLPAMVSGSFLLMKFADNEVELKGLTEQNCSKLLNPGDFSPEEVHQLWILSGGIPTLLRKAAEHAFNQKQNGKIEWNEVLKETYLDECPLLARWCKLLSANQVQILNMLANQKSNAGLSFEDGSLAIAAQALLKRGILINPVEAGTMREISGLYKFNTPLLKIYCKNHTLQAQTMSSFQVEQEAQHAEDNLKSTIEDPDLDYQILLEKYQKIAKIHHLPMPVDFSESITDTVLQEFELTRNVFDCLDQNVQNFIVNGIMVERTFANVDMLDFSPTYISFAKAVEAHINITVMPVLKKIAPDEIVNINGVERRLQDVDHLMLGAVKRILTHRYSGTGGTFAHKAGQFCMRNLNSFPETWWIKIINDLEPIRSSRNGIPHSDFFTSEAGKALLKSMFSGDKSFFVRCQTLYDTAKEKNLL